MGDGETKLEAKRETKTRQQKHKERTGYKEGTKKVSHTKRDPHHDTQRDAK